MKIHGFYQSRVHEHGSSMASPIGLLVKSFDWYSKYEDAKRDAEKRAPGVGGDWVTGCAGFEYFLEKNNQYFQLTPIVTRKSATLSYRELVDGELIEKESVFFQVRDTRPLPVELLDLSKFDAGLNFFMINNAFYFLKKDQEPLNKELLHY